MIIITEKYFIKFGVFYPGFECATYLEYYVHLCDIYWLTPIIDTDKRSYKFWKDIFAREATLYCCCPRNGVIGYVKSKVKYPDYKIEAGIFGIY